MVEEYDEGGDAAESVEIGCWVEGSSWRREDEGW